MGIESAPPSALRGGLDVPSTIHWGERRGAETRPRGVQTCDSGWSKGQPWRPEQHPGRVGLGHLHVREVWAGRGRWAAGRGLWLTRRLSREESTGPRGRGDLLEGGRPPC